MILLIQALTRFFKRRKKGQQQQGDSGSAGVNFLRTAAAARLHAAWHLSLCGLRRSEVLGLRWSDLDLNAKTLSVNQALTGGL